MSDRVIKKRFLDSLDAPETVFGSHYFNEHLKAVKVYLDQSSELLQKLFFIKISKGVEHVNFNH